MLSELGAEDCLWVQLDEAVEGLQIPMQCVALLLMWLLLAWILS